MLILRGCCHSGSSLGWYRFNHVLDYIYEQRNCFMFSMPCSVGRNYWLGFRPCLNESWLLHKIWDSRSTMPEGGAEPQEIGPESPWCIKHIKDPMDLSWRRSAEASIPDIPERILHEGTIIFDILLPYFSAPKAWHREPLAALRRCLQTSKSRKHEVSKIGKTEELIPFRRWDRRATPVTETRWRS